MGALEVLEALPAGYRVERGRRGVWAVLEGVRDAFAAQGFGPDADGGLESSELYGRQPLGQLRVGDERFVVRRFRHGGLLRWLTGERFFDPERPFRELILACELRARGVRTPEVVAARARPMAGGGYQLDLATRRVEDARDLGQLLAAARAGERTRRQLAPVLVEAGRLVRSLHDLGLAHADLNARNFLVERESLERGQPRLWILDLDRSELREHLGDSERRRNLRRLFRFVERREEQDGRVLTRSDYARFFRGYGADDERWKDDWRAIAAAHARHGRAHGAGWALERNFARSAGAELPAHPER